METHIWRRTFLKNCKKILFQFNFLKKEQESKVCPKKVGLFWLKVIWFEVKAGTNLGHEIICTIPQHEELKLCY